ncbi:MAG: hypothetical protein HZA07_06365 [Nitrospirae bacterium]|nr:hypothetical protein [Nitrospirota bacterium]
MKTRNGDDKKVELIKGMNRDTALKYVDARKTIDNKLCQLMAQGGMLSALGEVDHFELIHLSYAGDVIREIAEDVFGMLDEFIPVVDVQLELKEIEP